MIGGRRQYDCLAAAAAWSVRSAPSSQESPPDDHTLALPHGAAWSLVSCSGCANSVISRPHHRDRVLSLDRGSRRVPPSAVRNGSRTRRVEGGRRDGEAGTGRSSRRGKSNSRISICLSHRVRPGRRLRSLHCRTMATSTQQPDLAGKRLEILQEIVPSLSRLAAATGPVPQPSQRPRSRSRRWQGLGLEVNPLDVGARTILLPPSTSSMHGNIVAGDPLVLANHQTSN